MTPLFQSLTARGGAVAILGALLSYFGVDIAPEDLKALLDAILTVMTAAGGLMAILGKIRSNKRLTEIGDRP